MKTKSEKMIGWCFSGSVLVLLIAMLAYAGQPRQTPSKLKGRPAVNAASAVDGLKPVEVDPDSLSYQGPGRVYTIPEGGILVFVPGENASAKERLMGIGLGWDTKTILAALDGKIDLVDLTGWLDIAYDTETGILQVEVTDESDQVFEHAYELNADGKVDPSEYIAFVDHFFQYMRGEAEAEAGQAGGGTVAASTCSCTSSGNGNSCTCSCNPNCASCSCDASCQTPTCVWELP